MVNEKKPASKAYPVRITTNALRNIDEITGYIAFINHQPVNAVKVGEAIFSVFQRIEQTPFAFKPCGEIATKTKMHTNLQTLGISKSQFEKEIKGYSKCLCIENSSSIQPHPRVYPCIEKVGEEINDDEDK